VIPDAAARSGRGTKRQGHVLPCGSGKFRRAAPEQAQEHLRHRRRLGILQPDSWLCLTTAQANREQELPSALRLRSIVNIAKTCLERPRQDRHRPSGSAIKYTTFRCRNTITIRPIKALLKEAATTARIFGYCPFAMARHRQALGGNVAKPADVASCRISRTDVPRLGHQKQRVGYYNRFTISNQYVDPALASAATTSPARSPRARRSTSRRLFESRRRSTTVRIDGAVSFPDAAREEIYAKAQKILVD